MDPETKPLIGPDAGPAVPHGARATHRGLHASERPSCDTEFLDTLYSNVEGHDLRQGADSARSWWREGLKRWMPITEWLPRYSKSKLVGDLIAGFTVGMMVLPQGLADSNIAGLPPEYGAWAALAAPIVYGFAGATVIVYLNPRFETCCAGPAPAGRGSGVACALRSVGIWQLVFAWVTVFAPSSCRARTGVQLVRPRLPRWQEPARPLRNTCLGTHVASMVSAAQEHTATPGSSCLRVSLA